MYAMCMMPRRTAHSIHPELHCTLGRMENQQNLVNLGDGIICQLPQPVEDHNQVVLESQNDDSLTMRPPIL